MRVAVLAAAMLLASCASTAPRAVTKATFIVIRLIQGQPKHYRMDGPDKLRITLDVPDAASRFNAVRGLLAALAPS